MPNYGKFDLTGAPPAQGKAPLAHIHPGPYVFETTSYELKTDDNENAEKCSVRHTVIEGEHVGEEIGDNFSFLPTASGSRYPMQRWHAYLLSLGLPVREASFRLDFDNILHKPFIGHVVDRTMDARTDNQGRHWDARVVSNIASYEALPEGTDETNALMPHNAPAVAPSSNGATAPAAQPSAPVTDDVASDVEELFPA